MTTQRTESFIVDAVDSSSRPCKLGITYLYETFRGDDGSAPVETVKGGGCTTADGEELENAGGGKFVSPLNRAKFYVTKDPRVLKHAGSPRAE
jgi:hypothetical protein